MSLFLLYENIIMRTFVIHMLKGILEFVIWAFIVFCVLITLSLLYNNDSKNTTVVQQPIQLAYSWPHLTFDDWPSIYTPQVLDILKEYNVKASFYIVGKNIEGNENTIMRMYNEWHRICWHTFFHEDITKMINEELLSNADYVYNKLNEIVPWLKEKCFRPPYWKLDERTTNVLTNAGYTIDWSLAPWVLDSMDWKLTNGEDIYQGIINKTGYSSIVFHDTKASTVDAVRMYVKSLAK